MTTEREFAIKVAGGEELQELAKSFKRAMAAVRRLRGRETHHPDELSYARYGLLFGLADSGPLSARDIACSADLTPATVAQMLDSLASAGLVERERSLEDKRVVFTSLTEHGRELVAERRSTLEERWQAALAEFSPEELRTAAVVLDRLRELFHELAERPS